MECGSLKQNAIHGQACTHGLARWNAVTPQLTSRPRHEVDTLVTCEFTSRSLCDCKTVFFFCFGFIFLEISKTGRLKDKSNFILVLVYVLNVNGSRKYERKVHLHYAIKLHT